MKRRDLMKQIADRATSIDEQMVLTEGGNHTRVYVGNRRTVVARHNEIPDILAKKILKQIGAKP